MPHLAEAHKLSGKGAHTWLGMIGYVTKDWYEPHFKVAKSSNVTLEVS